MAQTSWKSILDSACAEQFEIELGIDSPHIWCKMLLGIKINSYIKAIFCHSKQLINIVDGNNECLYSLSHTAVIGVQV